MKRTPFGRKSPGEAKARTSGFGNSTFKRKDPADGSKPKSGFGASKGFKPKAPDAKADSGQADNDKAGQIDRKTGARPVPEHRKEGQRIALAALRKAKRAAEAAGVTLSEWEDEFLGSLSERVKTYGRAFADPEKGDPRSPLSVMQGLKLKEITKKATGKGRGRRKARVAEDD